jgi:hypothetical protein
MLYAIYTIYYIYALHTYLYSILMLAESEWCYNRSRTNSSFFLCFCVLDGSFVFIYI